jgi:hypothetical protein
MPEPSIGQDSKIDFSRDIQPILSENCYFCHGPDPNHREADLRLDLEEEAAYTFEPGDAANSDLILRITSDDPDELMPPPDSNRKVSEEDKLLIKRWIDEGAEWKQHWAFSPIERPEVPNEPIGLSPIDAFIQQKLNDTNLVVTPPANRETIVRRVSLDLTGLPPTPEQVQTFVDDDSPDAYEKLVDRTLASPAFGERMAWDWLDAARYADTNGYQGDNERTMWPWRDWVIKSYNENMPFDQFSIWQIAGDLLPNATNEQILATGFNRNHPINGEGGRIAEENRVDYVMDMAETTGTVWMGLTFNCCRCHDHKYDQLTQEDYYSMYAFFDQTPVTGGGGNAKTPPVLPVPNATQSAKKQELNNLIVSITAKLNQQKRDIAPQQAAWEKAERESTFETDNWFTIDPDSTFGESAKLKEQNDLSILASGPNKNTDVYRIIGRPKFNTVSGIRLEALNHHSMTKGGLSRSNSSNFVLTDFSVSIIDDGGQPQPIKIASAIADFEQFPVSHAIDDAPKTGWAVYAKDKDMRQEHEAVFIFAEPITLPEGAQLQVVLKHQSKHKQHNLGRFRLSTTWVDSPELLGANSDLVAALKKEPEKRSKQEENLIRLAFHDQDAQVAAIKKKLERVQSRLKKVDQQVPRVMVMADMPKPRKSYRLDRGSYQSPLNEVFPRVPSMLDPLPKSAKPDRLALANWLFDNANPLTARVAINRLWAQFFGIGLVKTTEDFGVQGEPPSHPELLDWLAAEYQESGWDTKHMIRLMLMSNAYQRSSKSDPTTRDVDPDNRLLSHASRFRMPSWMIRDNALAASGRLVRDVGGRPVNTYQPAGVWEEASFGKKKYRLDEGNDLYRRSLYTFWRRIAPPTMFFDNTDRLVCSVKSFKTNTPLHALSTLNDVTFVEASRLLATSVLKKKLDDAATLKQIYLSVVARQPSEAENRILLAALQRTRAQFAAHPDDAKKFIASGNSSVDKEIEATELAAWSSLCLAIYNLDESLTRQ